MRILVTGANGQVGYELLRALAEKRIPLVALRARSLSLRPSQAKGEENHPLPQDKAAVHGQELRGRASARGDVLARSQSHPPRSPFLRKGEDKPTALLRKGEDKLTALLRKGEDKLTALLRKGEDKLTALPRKGEDKLTALPRKGEDKLTALPRKGEENLIIPATRDGTLENGKSCERIDLADDAAALCAALDRIHPDLIVNAAAYTAVDRAEDEPDLAQRVNGDAPGVLGAWAAQHNTRVVHYSTDYVFDGAAARPYREDATPHPLGVYGRTKLAGEIALSESGARHLIFRTAWVYAARGHNFLRTMLRLGAQREELRVVDDQIGAPTPARLIADLTAFAIARWCEGDDASPARLDGVYHLATSGQTSWCGFARAIFERTALHAPFDSKGGAQRRTRNAAPQARGDVSSGEESHPPQSPFVPKGEAGAASAEGFRNIHPLRNEGGRRAAPGGCDHVPRITAITTADYPTRARRPAYSVLDSTKLRETFGVELPTWQAALDDVIGELAG